MAKYSFEFKKQVVMEYLNGEGGKEYLARKHNIPSSTDIMMWVGNYKAFGDEGLKRSRKRKTYSFEYKLHVVELYLSSELSYLELAIQEGINSPSLIAQWVLLFRTVGPDALRPRKKGRKKTMQHEKHKPKQHESAERSMDANVEHLKELEEENLRLRIENAFLKELRRLRLEEEALLKKQRESSTASEENSN